jgi:glycosyltransferase involved in cell wall biosynthesis
MRIGIDGRLLYYRRAGIGQYTMRLVEALVQAARGETLLLFHDRRQQAPLGDTPGLRHVPLFTPSHHRWESAILPLELSIRRLDLLHSPDFILPLRRNYAGVVTVHDLAFLRFPQWVTPEAARYYGQVRQAMNSAERVIAVSECTKEDLLELLDVPEEKVRVIYEAAGRPFRPLNLTPSERRVFKGRHLGPGQFAFFISTIEPRKNLPTLLQAFRKMLDRYADLEPHPRLIIAGAQGWLHEEVFGLMRKLDLGQQVSFIGPVSQQDLVWLYNAARFLVFPSFYEGFGLPPLEAMACGTPVIASNAGSLPEVVGDAGILIDPRDVGGWAEAMAHLWSDGEEREHLRTQGLQQAARFSWERAAQETLEVYQEAVALRREGGHG